MVFTIACRFRRPPSLGLLMWRPRQSMHVQGLPNLWRQVSGSGIGRPFNEADTAMPENKIQIYLSSSTTPETNLAFENYLIKETPPDSVILFLYSNQPCIVIGRNQNPWTEVALSALSNGVPSEMNPMDERFNSKPQLLRRRSGGGTVWHDLGNLNWCVMGPAKDFDRDKHALMVVRALHRLGFTNTRVNQRHDIVMDKPLDPQRNNEASGDAPGVDTRKVSGSAYKVTRLRYMHHGTTLLSSKYLGYASCFLDSPAARFIEARGSPSVKSPITNIEAYDHAAVHDAIIAEFTEMYGKANLITRIGRRLSNDKINQESAELVSSEWTYNQTPQFTFRYPGDHHVLPKDAPANFSLVFTAREGKIMTCTISGLSRFEPLGSGWEQMVLEINDLAQNNTQNMTKAEKEEYLLEQKRKIDAKYEKTQEEARMVDSQLSEFLVGTELGQVDNWGLRFTRFERFRDLNLQKANEVGNYLNRLLVMSKKVPNGMADIDLFSAEELLNYEAEQRILKTGSKLIRKVNIHIHKFYFYAKRTIMKISAAVLRPSMVVPSTRHSLLARVELAEGLLVSMARGINHDKLWFQKRSLINPPGLRGVAWDLRVSRLRLEGKLRDKIQFALTDRQTWRPKLYNTRGKSEDDVAYSPIGFLKHIVRPGADLSGRIPQPVDVKGPPRLDYYTREGLSLLAQYDFIRDMSHPQLVWLLAEGVMPRYIDGMAIPPAYQEKWKSKLEILWSALLVNIKAQKQLCEASNRLPPDEFEKYKEEIMTKLEEHKRAWVNRKLNPALENKIVMRGLTKAQLLAKYIKTNRAKGSRTLEDSKLKLISRIQLDRDDFQSYTNENEDMIGLEIEEQRNLPVSKPVRLVHPVDEDTPVKTQEPPADEQTQSLPPRRPGSFMRLYGDRPPPNQILDKYIRITSADSKAELQWDRSRPKAEARSKADPDAIQEGDTDEPPAAFYVEEVARGPNSIRQASLNVSQKPVYVPKHIIGGPTWNPTIKDETGDTVSSSLSDASVPPVRAGSKTESKSTTGVVSAEESSYFTPHKTTQAFVNSSENHDATPESVQEDSMGALVAETVSTGTPSNMAAEKATLQERTSSLTNDRAQRDIPPSVPPYHPDYARIEAERAAAMSHREKPRTQHFLFYGVMSPPTSATLAWRHKATLDTTSNGDGENRNVAEKATSAAASMKIPANQQYVELIKLRQRAKYWDPATAPNAIGKRGVFRTTRRLQLRERPKTMDDDLETLVESPAATARPSVHARETSAARTNRGPIRRRSGSAALQRGGRRIVQPALAATPIISNTFQRPIGIVGWPRASQRPLLHKLKYQRKRARREAAAAAKARIDLD